MAMPKQTETRTPAKASDDNGLLTLVKEGESIRVHPTQTALWITQGWAVQE